MRVFSSETFLEPTSTNVAHFDKVDIGVFPSPVNRVYLGQACSFWVKDESSTHPIYGGNKVRKLEYYFAWARQNKVRRLVVWGDALSHTVEAVSVLGCQLGFEVAAVVYQEKKSGYVSGQVQRYVTGNARVHYTSNFVQAYFLARLMGMRAGSTYIPLGATTDYSTLGHVSAAYEFVEQWRLKNLELPEKIYLALGSGGSIAGMAIGFALMGVPVKINAVQTVNASITNHKTLKKQIEATLKLLGTSKLNAASIIRSYVNIDRRYLGRGYGDITAPSIAAVKKAAGLGIELECVHTGKVMAAIFQDLENNSSQEILYWHTHSSTHDETCANGGVREIL